MIFNYFKIFEIVDKPITELKLKFFRFPVVCFVSPLAVYFGRAVRRRKTNMASSMDVHVRICAQEIIKYDLEIKALIQV